MLLLTYHPINLPCPHSSPSICPSVILIFYFKCNSNIYPSIVKGAVEKSFKNITNNNTISKSFANFSTLRWQHCSFAYFHLNSHNTLNVFLAEATGEKTKYKKNKNFRTFCRKIVSSRLQLVSQAATDTTDLKTEKIF